MKGPDFIIIGAAKAGTTAVFHYLREHPQVGMSQLKETNFFANLVHGGCRFREYGDIRWEEDAFIDTLPKYLAQFAAVQDRPVRGEASPWYLFEPRCAAAVQAFNPAMKIVAILRDPAERAWSDFLHNLRDGTEPCALADFATAFADGGRREQEGYSPHANYARKGFYAQQLAAWQAAFPPPQVLVLFYEDLVADPAAFMSRLYAFIGVDPGFRPDFSQRYNVTGLPRNRRLHDFLRRPNALKRLLRRFLPRALLRRTRERLEQRNLERMPPLPAATRAQLVGHYREDILALQQMTGRDLSRWLRTGDA